MQINSFNGSLQNRYFSGTGSIGGIHLPDFHDQYVFSKKKSGISDEECLQIERVLSLLV